MMMNCINNLVPVCEQPLFFKVEKAPGVPLDIIQFAGTKIPIQITPYVDDASPVFCFPFEICETKISKICTGYGVSSFCETSCVSAILETDCSENYQFLSEVYFSDLVPRIEDILVSGDCEAPKYITKKYLDPILNITISVTGTVEGITLTGISEPFNLYPLDSELILKGEDFSIAEEILKRMPDNVALCDGSEIFGLSNSQNFRNYISTIFDNTNSYNIYGGISNFFENHKDPERMTINSLVDISTQLNIPLIDYGISDGPYEINKLLQIFSMNPINVFGFDSTWDLGQENIGDLLNNTSLVSSGQKIWMKDFKTNKNHILHLTEISGQDLYTIERVRENITDVAPFLFDTISPCYPTNNLCFYEHIVVPSIFPENGIIDREKNTLYLDEDNWEDIGEILFAAELTKGLFSQ
jgi:hypothetical protein